MLELVGLVEWSRKGGGLSWMEQGNVQDVRRVAELDGAG